MKLLILAGAAALAPPPIAVEAVPSTYFVIDELHVNQVDGAMQVDGRICRRLNRSALTPARLQVERIGADDTIVDTQFAYPPSLSRRADQRCGSWSTKLKASEVPVMRVRVCLARKASCPIRD